MDLLLAAAQLFIEQMPAAIAIFDGGMRYQAVSRRHLSDLAWLFSSEVLASDKVIGRTFFEVSPEAPPRWRHAYDRVLAGEELSHEQDFVPRKDGRAVWVRWSMRPWRNVNDRIGGALLISELITERVEMRRALAETELQFRATFENAAVGIAHAAPDGKLLRVNKAMSCILGWPADELINSSFHNITQPDDLAQELVYLRQMHEGVIDSYAMDKRFVRKDGATIWGKTTVSAVHRDDGRAAT